jgi:serine/threonine-protein kinase
MICPRCHRRYDGDHQFCPHDGERLVEGIDVKRIRAKPTEAQGTVVGGRYQVRGLIGRGAMAQVFLALDQRTNQPVALKVMGAKHLGDKRLVARFLQEAKAAADVTHRGIVEMLDVGLAEDGSPYLVMELLFGESLGDWLRREKTMTPDRGLPLLRQVAEALATVHRAGIVHRDVKPDNVFLQGERGDPHTAKLLDFGYAKLGQQQNALTAVGVTVGTVEYMSPEQATGDTVDARVDVYGLGVLMYRTFAGRLPFPGTEAGEMLARHLVEEAPPLTLTGTPLGSGLGAIVAKALRKHPDNRYASVDALIDDLVRLESGQSLAARLPPAVDDVYVPRGAFAQQAVTFLYKKLGKEPPR